MKELQGRMVCASLRFARWRADIVRPLQWNIGVVDSDFENN